jgi:hypothetical protein
MAKADSTVVRRPIPGFSGYSASEDGKIWSRTSPLAMRGCREQNPPWHELRLRGRLRGPRARLCHGGGRAKDFPVSHLVLLAFAGPCPEGMEPRHRDGDLLNCRLSNLCWDLPRRYCRRCGEYKPLTDFPRSQKMRGGRAYRCKICQNTYSQRWRKDNPHLITANNRRHHLSSTHGLCLAEYEAMHAAQHGLCAVCGKPEMAVRRSGKIRLLCVDHDHDTGKIRGLLCAACNIGMGNFKDDPELLGRAAAYLQRHRA